MSPFKTYADNKSCPCVRKPVMKCLKEFKTLFSHFLLMKLSNRAFLTKAALTKTGKACVTTTR